jgi:hypothetical protein
VQSGELVQGSLRVNAKNTSEAFVSVHGYSRDGILTPFGLIFFFEI